MSIFQQLKQCNGISNHGQSSSIASTWQGPLWTLEIDCCIYQMHDISCTIQVIHFNCHATWLACFIKENNEIKMSVVSGMITKIINLWICSRCICMCDLLKPGRVHPILLAVTSSCFQCWGITAASDILEMASGPSSFCDYKDIWES